MRTGRFLLRALAATSWIACSSAGNDEVVRTDQAAATSVEGFCRTTTCAAPANYPMNGACEPPDWPQRCADAKMHDVPLWWRSGCIGYTLPRVGGKHISLDDLQTATAAGFAAWTTRSCRSDGSGESHPSIDARFLAPVACDEATYNQRGPNQNLIAFRDDEWPYKAKEGVPLDKPSPTIALTTVTFNSETGEIRDADIELNTADHTVIPLSPDAPLDGNTYDLQSVLTHEIGHVFGLAHSPSKEAAMYAEDEGHGTRKRTIALEDVAGLCSIYPPDGNRSVATSVDPSGRIARTACDPTPQGGFTSDCAPPPKQGCNATGRGASDAGVLLAALALARSLGQIFRTRRRGVNARAR